MNRLTRLRRLGVESLESRTLLTGSLLFGDIIDVPDSPADPRGPEHQDGRRGDPRPDRPADVRLSSWPHATDRLDTDRPAGDRPDGRRSDSDRPDRGSENDGLRLSPETNATFQSNNPVASPLNSPTLLPLLLPTNQPPQSTSPRSSLLDRTDPLASTLPLPSAPQTSSTGDAEAPVAVEAEISSVIDGASETAQTATPAINADPTDDDETGAHDSASRAGDEASADPIDTANDLALIDLIPVETTEVDQAIPEQTQAWELENDLLEELRRIASDETRFSAIGVNRFFESLRESPDQPGPNHEAFIVVERADFPAIAENAAQTPTDVQLHSTVMLHRSLPLLGSDEVIPLSEDVLESISESLNHVVTSESQPTTTGKSIVRIPRLAYPAVAAFTVATVASRRKHKPPHPDLRGENQPQP